MSWRNDLWEAFGDAMSATVGVASQVEALEEALSIADGWQMRLDELEKEEKEGE